MLVKINENVEVEIDGYKDPHAEAPKLEPKKVKKEEPKEEE